MIEKICYIVGAGSFEIKKIDVKENDLVIAADGGYDNLKSLEISPNILLGDFDSISKIPSVKNIIQHPAEKDETDMMLAVEKGLENGYNCFVIYGGLGGRLDHTLANIQTLIYLSKKDVSAYFVGEGVVITAITNTEIEIKGKEKNLLSAFCFENQATGVWEWNLKYKLENATLTCSVPTGVSNEFTSKPAKIKVEDGTLVIMWNESEFNIENIIR